MQKLYRIVQCLSLFACLHVVEVCFAQNLVPNPNFEENTGCPDDFGQIYLAPPWTNGNAASIDYFHTCAEPGGPVGVPWSWVANQNPLSGQAFAGVYAGSRFANDYRAYLMAPLLSPLVADQCYQVSFYVNLAEVSTAIVPFGALFTVGPPVYDSYHTLDYQPQIETNGGLLGNFTDWTLVSRSFIADGGEDYITIGNFRDIDHTPWDTAGWIIGGMVGYYLIEDVSVVALPATETEFTLDPVTACAPYEIYPGDAANYHWNDGTTNPTLSVTESGTYYITLSDACAFAYGQIDVTILPNAPPVMLPEDTIICAGETIDIALDPDLGEYAWQDGSSGPDYTISEEGMHIVTMTDDCDQTSDTIVVTFLDPPGSFSLGVDTAICTGDAITLSFDPGLGMFMWQDGSMSATYTIDDNGTYALTISNMCGQAEDELEVEVIAPPDFTIGPDEMALCVGDSIVIDLDPTLGTFTWHDGSSENMLTVHEGGLISVVVANSCFSAEDEMLVTEYAPPEFSLGPDMTLCESILPVFLDLSDIKVNSK